MGDATATGIILAAAAATAGIASATMAPAPTAPTQVRVATSFEDNLGGKFLRCEQPGFGEGVKSKLYQPKRRHKGMRPWAWVIW